MLEINNIYKGIGMMTIMYLLRSTIINYFLGLGYLIELYKYHRSTKIIQNHVTTVCIIKNKMVLQH